MALNKVKLKEDIKSAFKAEQHETDADKSLERIATKISDAIDKYVRAGVVNTTGTATAQTGKMT